MKYLMAGTESDVSASVARLLRELIRPQAQKIILRSPNDFRDLVYIEDVDIVLRRHEAALRLICRRHTPSACPPCFARPPNMAVTLSPIFCRSSNSRSAPPSRRSEGPVYSRRLREQIK